MITYTHIDSPVGRLLLVGEDGALVGLYYPDHRRGRTPDDHWKADDGAFAGTWTQLVEYFAGDRRGFDVRVVAAGTPFQRRVWAAMSEIDYGRTATYADLAHSVGRPGAARAVGSAVARNPVSIVLPCHRVVGTAGRLTGYAGGTDRKRHLLDLEAAAVGRPVSRPAPTG